MSFETLPPGSATTFTDASGNVLDTSGQPITSGFDPSTYDPLAEVNVPQNYVNSPGNQPLGLNDASTAETATWYSDFLNELGLYTNPNTGNLAITDAVKDLPGTVAGAASAISDAATKGVLTIINTLEIVLGLTAVIVLGVLIFRYGPAPKKE
jgi:hypothetical protein